MGATSDNTYADRLVAMLRDDRARMASEPRHASVVLWMVEELRTAAVTLKLERQRAKALLVEASEAREAALKARRSLKRPRRVA